MMTLYTLAHELGGCVGSTDNHELAPGFGHYMVMLVMLLYKV